MNPQLSATSWRVLSFLLLSLLCFAQPAWSAPPPACVTADFSNPNPVALIATPGSTPPSVTFFDLLTNTPRCSLTAGIGNNPTHLAISPDSSLLFVENDRDTTISVISLADGSQPVSPISLSSFITPGTSGITGNLAVSPDGTFLYVVAFPAPFPSTTPAAPPVIVRIGIPSFTASSPGLLTSNGNQAAGDIGISFLPDATKAYVAFDAGNTYEITVSPFSVGSVIAATSVTVTGGGVAVSASAGGPASGDFAYVVQTPTTNGANPIQIPVATNVPAPTGAISGQNACSQANTVTTSPDGAFAYYTCPANNSVQVVNISQNQIINTINLSGSPTPFGIEATADNSELIVANQNATVILITSPTTSPTPTTAIAGPGAYVGVRQRPVLLSPTTPTVNTVSTQQFTLLYAFGTSGISWSVDGIANGNSTVGTLTTTPHSSTNCTGAKACVYNPPTTAGSHTISVFSPEIYVKSLRYPGQTASTTVSVVAIAVTVTPNPSSLDLSTSTTTQFTGNVTNDPANGGVKWTGTAGTFSPTSTASGVATTYTAPRTIMSPASVTVTATSVSDPGAFGNSSLTLTSSIVFSPIGFTPAAPLLIENTDTVSTSLTGDPYSQGVTWSIAGCSAATPATPACGSINAGTGLYTPPLIVPYASQAAPVAPATITFLATSVTDTSKTSQTSPIQITSSVAFTGTGFQVNGGAPPAQLVIETTSYALTPTLTGDTGQGVKWSIASCSADPAGGPLCGSVTVGGTYTPPKIVPYALPVTSSSIATVTFRAISIADALVSKAFTINVGSTVTITGYNINGAAISSSGFQLLIETSPYNLTPQINNDTGQGVTWFVLNCSADAAGGSKCGSISAAGIYAPPAVVPYALPVTSSSIASITFQAVSVADPKAVFQTSSTGPATINSSISLKMGSPSVLIGSNVDFTPKATASGNNVNMGTGANQSDLNLGVTLAITGTCIAPPNYTFSGKDGNGCGSFNGSQTASPPTYAYTAPAVVPMSATCATSPAGCLGTQNRASITVAATSVADPKQTSSTTFIISSNISFGVAQATDATTLKNICNPFIYSSTDTNFLTELANDPCGFAPAAPRTPVPTLAVGFTAALAESPNPQGFGSVTGLTWVATSGSVPSSSGTSTTFTAPTAVPSANGGAATITAYAVADFTKSAPFSLPIVASKLIPHNISPPFTLVVQSGQSTGTISLDFEGPTNGTITFSCPSFSNLTNSSCSFSPNPSNATGTTTVAMTLNITRTSSGHLQPLGTPLGPSPGLPGAVLAAIILVFLILAFAHRKRAFVALPPRLNGAAAIILLCALVMTWAVACGQFSPPAAPQQPIGGTPPATGFATVMSSPTTDSSSSTDSLPVPATVQP